MTTACVNFKAEVPLNLDDFELEWVFGLTTPQLRTELVSFWLESAALQNPYEGWRRSHEVACIARDKQHAIVSVSSVYCNILNMDNRTYWLYRTFVRPDSRFAGLAPRLFETVFTQLQHTYSNEKFSPQGVIVVAENEKLKRRSGLRIIQAVGLTHCGQTDQGQDVWVRKFAQQGLK